MSDSMRCLGGRICAYRHGRIFLRTIAKIRAFNSRSERLARCVIVQMLLVSPRHQINASNLSASIMPLQYATTPSSSSPDAKFNRRE